MTRPIPGLLTLGKECSWTFSPTPMNESSKVLSAGVGHDMSFELELVRRFGCEIYLLDPSPTGQRTWAVQSLKPREIHFYPWALGAQDGEMFLAEPLDFLEGSYRSLAADFQKGLKVPVRSVKFLMELWNLKSIDLLKLDIEGGEFAVIAQMVSLGIRPAQICVEFHHGNGFPTKRGDTLGSMLSLVRNGYRLIHRLHWDHTFIRKDFL